MASQKELLSVKGQDKMEKLQGATWQDMGGPELDWSPEKYMSSATFNVALGIKPDSTILAKAGVKAEKGETVKEGKDMDDMDDDMLTDSLFAEGEEGEEGEEHEKHEKDEKDEDEEEMSEAMMSDDEDEMQDPDGDEMVKEAESEDKFEFSLDELTDGDVDMMDLGEEDDEEEAAHEDEDEKHEKAKKHEKDEAEDEDEVEEGYHRMMREAEDEEDAAVEDEDAGEDEDEVEEGYRMMREEDDEEEMADEDEDEKKPVEESRLVLSFKFDETDRLFESNQMLSEEDKQQSRRLFEAAIRGVAKQVSTKLNEAYAQKFARVKKQHEQRLAKQVDQYLNYVVEQWAKENKVALRSQIQTKLTESFLSNLKSVFTQHYVDIPESKVNVVAALAKNVKSLKQQVRESEARTLKLHTEMKSAVARERQSLIREHRARLIAEAAAALPAVDRGAFAKRAETVSFTNTKNYKKDLVALREQYFGAKKSITERTINLPDAAPLHEEESVRSSKTSIDVYADAVSRFTR